MFEKIKSIFVKKIRLYRLEKHVPGIVGWNAIMEFPNKISKKQAEQYFEPNAIYRLTELDENGKFVRKIWEHSTLLPRTLKGEERIEEEKEEKRRKEKEPSAIDFIEAGKAWLAGVAEDLRMIRELMKEFEGGSEGGHSIKDEVKNYLRQVKEDYEAIYGPSQKGLTISELMSGRIPENILTKLPDTELAKTFGEIMKINLWREIGASLIDYGTEKLKEIKESVLPTSTPAKMAFEPLSLDLFKRKKGGGIKIEEGSGGSNKP
jgi:hypothetical protein